MDVVKIGWVILVLHIVRDKLSVIVAAFLFKSKILKEIERSDVKVWPSQ